MQSEGVFPRWVRPLVAALFSMALWVVAMPARAALLQTVTVLAAQGPALVTPVKAPLVSLTEADVEPTDPEPPSIHFRDLAPRASYHVSHVPSGPAPRRSSAPFCDDRGAVGFAPTPLLLAPATSVDVGESEDCQDAFRLAPAFREGGIPGHRVAAPAVDVTLVAPVALPPRGEARLHAFVAFASPGPHGAAVRLERPPRA